nr:MAG TPA: hypothetical protein [Caudoviricetes sp.]
MIYPPCLCGEGDFFVFSQKICKKVFTNLENVLL